MDAFDDLLAKGDEVEILNFLLEKLEETCGLMEELQRKEKKVRELLEAYKSVEAEFAKPRRRRRRKSIYERLGGKK